MHRLALLFSVGTALIAQEGGSAMSAPALPYLDWHACPFEGCTYREWTARGTVEVFDSWKEPRRAIAQLKQGDKVTGLDGVVVTYKPGVILMDRAMPELKLKPGDKILTFTNRGEGQEAVWFNGRFYASFDPSAFTKSPETGRCAGSICAATIVDRGRKSWWAEVKLRDGRKGWVKMDGAGFDGVDKLAAVLMRGDLAE